MEGMAVGRGGAGMSRWLVGLMAAVIAILQPAVVSAAVERYKTEGEYLARLAALGHTNFVEDFEGGEWDGLRSVFPDQNLALSNTGQRVTWSSSAEDLWPYTGTIHITTNPNWARGDGWGLYDTYLASTIRIAVPEPIYGVGLWVDTNPDSQDVGFLFPGRTTANDPGYVLTGYGAMYPGDNPGSGHTFIGIIDPDGFTEVIITGTLQVNEENQLEGGVVFGVDDFTFGVASGFLLTPLQQWRVAHFAAADLGDPAKGATVWGNDADPDLDAITNLGEYLFGGDPNVADAAAAALTAGIETVGGQPRLHFSYNRRTNDPSLAYIPKVSADMGTWYSGTAYVEELGAVVLGGDMERVTCRDTGALAPGGPVFGLVEVTGPGP